MDAIDRKIIRNLQQNGRLTNQELSERINLSPSPCLRRVRALEEQGVITGYTTIVDEDKYGLPFSVFVSIRLERHSDECIKSFEDGIEQLDEVLECYLVTGTFDYLLRVVSKNLKTYETFVREKISIIPGVAGIDSSFAFGLVKNKKTLPEISKL